MSLSFLLRLDSRELAQGRVVGEIEEVMTGQVGELRSAADVFSFCTGAAGEEVGVGCEDAAR